MNRKMVWTNRMAALLMLVTFSGVASLPKRAELMAFPFKTAISQAGTYTVEKAGQDLVLSGTITGDVIVDASQVCRVTLDNLTLTGTITLTGETVLWARGTSALTNPGASTLVASNAVLLAGTGTVTLTGGGAKKANAVIHGEDTLSVVGGTWNVEQTYTAAADGYGIAASKKLSFLAGTVNVTSTCTGYRTIGVASAKKNVVLDGGLLRVVLAGPRSIGIRAEADDASVKLEGGAAILTLDGDGARGVQTDGTYEQCGGILNASLAGDPLYEAAEYGDGTNLTVTVSSSTLVSSGTYLVEDVTVATAVKCGAAVISGGTLRIDANGIASRGLVASTSLDVSGGVFDIQANGAASNPVIDLVTDGILTQVELDRKTATCLKQSATNGVVNLTGGTFYLTATNSGGKCLSVAGNLTIGTAGATTLPTDTSFAPDLQCTTYGEQIYVGSRKLDTYKTLGTAVATTSVGSAIQLSSNTSRVVSGSGESVDYANPKCVKAEGDITMESGRLRMFSKSDGGEGLESKQNLTVNGGLIEGTCYDDVIQATDTITINGGYLYCGSTGNDGVDANSTIIVNGGVLLAFTLKTPEVGIDVDSSANLKINGGVVLAVGSATTMQYGSKGTQSSYLKTSATLSTYAGKYLQIAGTSYYVKVPTASSSGSCSIMCSAPGCSTSAPTVTTTPAGSDTGFHGVYTPNATLAWGFGPGGGGGGGGGGGDPGGGGGNQPDQPGGSSGFTFDTFLTDAAKSGGCITYGTLLTGTVPGTSALILTNIVTDIAPGVFAGNTTIQSIDLSAASGLTHLPKATCLGCSALTTLTLPAGVTKFGGAACSGCSSLTTLTAAGLTNVNDMAFFACSSLTSVPSAVTTYGDWSFSQSGITSIDLASAADVGEGVCASCTALASATAPTSVPDATFAGCTTLAFTQLATCSKLGDTAFAGVPFATIRLADGVTLGTFCLAADTAWETTDIVFGGETTPTTNELTFAGRTSTLYFTPTDQTTCRLEALPLVQWLEENPTVEQPASYATADVRTWLGNASHAAAFVYAQEKATDPSFTALSVEGTDFLFTAQRAETASTVTANLQVSPTLVNPQWTTVPSSSIANGIYSAPYQPQAFARIFYSIPW